MARRFQSQRIVSRRRPNRSWAGIAEAAVTNVPAASKVLLASLTLSNPNIDETHLRTVGICDVRTDNSAATEEQFGAFGMIFVTDTALAAGVASIPGPTTDIADDGWFVYVPFSAGFLVSTAVGLNPDFAHIFHFDSKAKRRVEEGTSVALVAENVHANHGFNIRIHLRSLTMITGT